MGTWRKGRFYRLAVRFDLPIKDKRLKNEDTSASTPSHTSLSFGRQSGEELGVGGGGGFRGNGIHGLHLLNPHGDKRLAQQKYRLLERRGATMEIISEHEKQFGQRQPSSLQHVGPSGASGGPQ